MSRLRARIGCGLSVALVPFTFVFLAILGLPMLLDACNR